MRTLLWVAILIVTCVTGDEKCCPGLECYSLDAPWSSLTRIVPEPNCNIDVRIYLYTRSNPTEPHEVSMSPGNETISSPYNKNKKITVYIHGLGDCGLCNHSLTVKQATLLSEDVNMFLLDYGSISDELYPTVVSNSRVIASILARFLKSLIEQKKARPEDMYLVGHSVGAHIAGYTARKIPNLSRVTGLDPAGALYDSDEEVRLNKNDADFVDIGHTYANPLIPLGGVGIKYSIGDVDFYFNGGWLQPGCGREAVEGVVQQLTDSSEQTSHDPVTNDFLACPHVRAIYYYAEAVASLKNCTFWGVRRANQSLFSSISNDEYEAKVSACTIDTCSPWGLRAIEFPARGDFDVRTSDTEPFCNPRSDMNARLDIQLVLYNISSFVANVFNSIGTFIKNIFNWF